MTFLLTVICSKYLRRLPSNIPTRTEILVAESCLHPRQVSDAAYRNEDGTFPPGRARSDARHFLYMHSLPWSNTDYRYRTWRFRDAWLDSRELQWVLRHLLFYR